MRNQRRNRTSQRFELSHSYMFLKKTKKNKKIQKKRLTKNAWYDNICIVGGELIKTEDKQLWRNWHTR